MLVFIYLAYQMMALLYETVLACEDTWIKCIGDLRRCRMANEGEYVPDCDDGCDCSITKRECRCIGRPLTSCLFQT
jgi:hypothetical protein